MTKTTKKAINTMMTAACAGAAFCCAYAASHTVILSVLGAIIMVDDDRMKLRPGEKIEHKSVRFRTLGCYPLTGGCESTATTLDEIIDETLSAVSSERTTRVIDNEAAGSMERRKREGYF